MKPNYISISCQNFTFDGAKSILNALVVEGTGAYVYNHMSFRATMMGIEHGTHTLPWNEVEILHKKLKEMDLT